MKPTFSGAITYRNQVFNLNKRPLYMPVLHAIVRNMFDQDIGSTEQFLIDTGASISILTNKYSTLFKNDKQIDTMVIQYGREKPVTISVYNAKLKIKNTPEISLKMAIDPNVPYSVLGNVDFIERFRSIAIVNIKKNVHFFM